VRVCRLRNTRRPLMTFVLALPNNACAQQCDCGAADGRAHRGKGVHHQRARKRRYVRLLTGGGVHTRFGGVGLLILPRLALFCAVLSAASTRAATQTRILSTARLMRARQTRRAVLRL
jgi:hypothetical protein